MGRFSEPLADQFSDFAGIGAGQHVLDVGCGPGALTARLVQLLGPDGVSAIDPSPSFVEAVRARFPEIDVHAATAENLPFRSDTFDVALAQLVVHFMSDPVAGLSEMSRDPARRGCRRLCVGSRRRRRSPQRVLAGRPRAGSHGSGRGGARGGTRGPAGGAWPRSRTSRDQLRLTHDPPGFCLLHRMVGAIHPGGRSGRRLCCFAAEGST